MIRCPFCDDELESKQSLRIHIENRMFMVQDGKHKLSEVIEFAVDMEEILEIREKNRLKQI